MTQRLQKNRGQNMFQSAPLTDVRGDGVTGVKKNL